jgi:hypothetical protein
MKSELKIDYKNSDVLKELIQKSYFDDGQMGTLKGNKNSISVKTSDDVLHTILKGLGNSTIKLMNEELIDGSFRFIVDENKDEINLYPISVYCITLDDGRYSFY